MNKKKLLFYLIICFFSFRPLFSFAELMHYSFISDSSFLNNRVKAYQLVDNISPGSIDQGQTLTFTLTGRDFQTSTTIEVIPWDGLTMSNFKVEPPLKITFTLTASADAPTGSRNLVVYNPNGSYEVYSAIYVRSNLITNPTITSLHPLTGEAGQTYILSIIGTNFDSPEVTIGINNYFKYTYDIVSSTEIKGVLTIEADTPPGPHCVTVRNQDGGIAQSYFMVVKPEEGFKILGVWPSDVLPRGSVIQSFIIRGTGISTMAAVSFSDQNITFDPTKLAIDSNGKWIRIGQLQVGENTALGLCYVLVTNPDKTTAITGIVIKEKSEFLNIITNLMPVYSDNVTGFKLADGQPMEFKFMANKDISQASTYLIGPSGIAQRTDYVNIMRGSSVVVHGASTSDVRAFSVSSAGVGKISLPKLSDSGRDLSPGLYTLNLRVRATDGTEEMVKVKFVIRPQ